MSAETRQLRGGDALSQAHHRCGDRPGMNPRTDARSRCAGVTRVGTVGDVVVGSEAVTVSCADAVS
jgi:hypothetical protein